MNPCTLFSEEQSHEKKSSALLHFFNWFRGTRKNRTVSLSTSKRAPSIPFKFPLMSRIRSPLDECELNLSVLCPVITLHLISHYHCYCCFYCSMIAVLFIVVVVSQILWYHRQHHHYNYHYYYYSSTYLSRYIHQHRLVFILIFPITTIRYKHSPAHTISLAKWFTDNIRLWQSNTEHWTRRVHKTNEMKTKTDALAWLNVELSANYACNLS